MYQIKKSAKKALMARIKDFNLDPHHEIKAVSIKEINGERS